MLFRFPKPKSGIVVEEPKFFKGVLISSVICIPFWLVVLYFVCY